MFCRKKKRSSEIAHIHCFNTLTAFLLRNIKIYAMMYHAYDVLRMREKDESISLYMYWLIAVRTILSSKLQRYCSYVIQNEFSYLWGATF